MQTIFNPDTRKELIGRISLLKAEMKPEWGKMNVYQMVKHNTYWNAWILGTAGQVYRQTLMGKIFGKFALQRMIKDEKPLDKNIPTSEQFKVKKEWGDLPSEIEKWICLIEEYAHFSNPEFVHDFLGKMTDEQIGILVYKHTDHHLRQFRV